MPETVIRSFYNLLILLICLYSITSAATGITESMALQPATTTSSENISDFTITPIEKKQIKEAKTPADFFLVQLHKPTYILPFYYTGSPDNSVYAPSNQSIEHQEVKFQISFKVPIWKEIANRPYNLYFAYTQLSYWQLYQHDAFFRETDFEPELYLENLVNHKIIKDWHLNSTSLGIVHQSNGFGGTQERSWNRIYLQATTSLGIAFLGAKAWYIIKDSTFENDNPTMGNYLGHGSLLGGVKLNNQVIAIETRNMLTNKATEQLTYSFPITNYLKGYIELFNGYGQSLIEYDHHTTSAGIGVALNDWV
jgi:phospholipase A1